MIVHNLLIKLQDASGENIAKTRELLLSMQGKIEEIRELKVAVDIRRAESSYDLALMVKFNTMADVQSYLPHPYHLEVSNQIKSNIAAVASVCYEE